MDARILGLIAASILALPAAAPAAEINWNVTADYSCNYGLNSSGGTTCTYDSSFTPQTFSLTTVIDPTPTSTYGPTTSSGSGSSYAYTTRQASQNFAVAPSFSLADSPFAAVLDSYLTYGGSLYSQTNGWTTDYYYDYSYGGTDFGNTYLRITASKSGSTCLPPCSSSGYTVQGYQQYLQLYFYNTTLNSSLTDVTSLALASYLALLDQPGTIMRFSNSAVDYAYNVTCTTSCTSTYTKYDGKHYQGFVSSASVPEPGTVALAGLSLFGLGLTRRRRRGETS